MSSLNDRNPKIEWSSRLPATDRLEMLRLFSRIAETGSFTEAANAVGLSQPSASRALKQLETVTKVKLVERSTHGAALTPAGRSFLVRAHGLLADWDAALEAAHAERQALSGRIQVIAPVASGQTLFARVAAKFQLLHPDVTIELALQDGPIDMIGSGADLWICLGLPRDNLVVRRIYEVRRAIVASPAWPSVTHPRELVARPAVRRTSSVPATVPLTHVDGDTFALKQEVVFGTPSLLAAHTAVLEGVGYAILPLWILQSDLRSGALTMPCPSWQPPSIHVSLAYLPSGRSARLRALVEFFQRELTSAEGTGITFLREYGATEVVDLVTARR